MEDLVEELAQEWGAVEVSQVVEAGTRRGGDARRREQNLQVVRDAMVCSRPCRLVLYYSVQFSHSVVSDSL